ncbi:MAG: cadmium-translocating P-type ATPase, partial [Phycisphaerales bacterium]|nr:cadmium-translocating P-type ATPase [Phycisphaerales bacterium]
MASDLVNLLIRRRMLLIAGVAIAMIAAHLALRFGFGLEAGSHRVPLYVALGVGGLPLVVELLGKLFRGEFGSDLLAGISIVTSMLLGEYLAGAIVVLMLSGGEALESYAVRSASSVLRALAARMPSVAHRKVDGRLEDVPLDQVAPGDVLVVKPHDICPVDGVVVEGRGSMDEAYLTGEAFKISKIVGSEVISGAINGESALTIRTTRPAADSRYAKIMQVMRSSEVNRPRLRRLGDQLGAWYTPLAVAIAALAWVISGDPVRFLAVLVVATPCPLLIAIPVAIIGAISLCARRGIVIKSPVVLEKITTCRTAVFDKTGTLTYGRPRLVERAMAGAWATSEDSDRALALVAALERYSKHPLATAVVRAADEAGLAPLDASEIDEPPGQGLRGVVDGHAVRVTSRGALAGEAVPGSEAIPPHAGGLECLVVIDGRYAGCYRFRDEPRADGVSFISHLGPRHQFRRVMIVSGDRESEVRYLAERVGITDVRAEQTPEQKVEIVRRETAKARTLYVGDGINDAPAMVTATVGVAIGQASDVTTEAAGAVVMDSSKGDSSLGKVDELLHIAGRMRRVALESAVGGMALSVVGMGLASVGLLAPVAGALFQEVIDVFAVLN